MARFRFNPVTRQLDVVKDAVDLGAAFKGPYAEEATYSVGEVASLEGKLYVCLTASRGNLPPLPMYWEALQLQGPIGPQGPPGPMGSAGPSGDADNLFVAGETLGGHRMVTLNADTQAIHADNTNTSHAGRVVGLTLGSAVAGAEVVVRHFGLIQETSWQWDRARPRVFLSTTGLITQTVPDTGFVCAIGYVVSVTQLFITIQPSIHRT